MSTPADLQIFVGRDDVSAWAEEISFSAVDPGGFEQASFAFARSVRVPRGTPTKILLGQSTAWEGRIGNVNRQLSALPRTGLTCQGYGSRLKENGSSMIFVDRDLSRWGSVSTQRQIDLINANFVPEGSFQVAPDVNGKPSLRLVITGTVVLNKTAESWYSGRGNKIAKVYYDYNNQLVDAGAHGSLTAASWVEQMWCMPTDSFALGNSGGTGNLSAGPSAGYVTATADAFYLTLEHRYIGASAGTNGVWEADWRNLAVYGPHGLVPRGADPGGFYPSDIARWAVQQAHPTAQIDVGVIEDATFFIIPHLVYDTETAWEQIIDDAAKLCGFHYGTWEGTGINAPPRFDFRSRPSAPNCWISRQDCDDLQLDDAIDGLYNRAIVGYHGVNGVQGSIAASRSVPALDENGIIRTLYQDLGVGTSTTATAFGNLLLAISALNASTTGSFKTRQDVKVLGGARPACLLRPGLDRLKISDLSADGYEQTEFAVKRFEATVGAEGITTTVELGVGTNFLDVMQSQLAVEAQILGLG